MRIIIELQKCKECKDNDLQQIALQLQEQLTNISCTIRSEREHIKNIRIES